MKRVGTGANRTRRALLATVGVATVGLAGCLDDDDDDEEVPEDPEEESDDDDDAEADGEDETEDEEEVETDEEATDEPDPDVMVGSSEEADYETLQAAYDSFSSGVTIGLEPGEYTVQQTVRNAERGDGEELEKTFAYVGDDPAETTITIDVPEASAFTVRGPQQFLPEEGPPEFWNLTLEIPEEVSYTRVPDYDDDDWLDQFDDDAAEEYPESRTLVNNCRLEGTFDGPVTAVDTVFTSSIRHELTATDCEFEEPVAGGPLEVQDSHFRTSLEGRSGFVVSSTVDGQTELNGLYLLNCDLTEGLLVNGSGEVERCVIDPNEFNNAVTITSQYDAEITDSAINGAIRTNRDSAYISRFEGNTFDAPSGVTWLIDGAAPASELYLNAFYGGDVEITTDEADIEVYDSDRQLGNYYGAWDGVDDADEGTLSSRTLPGDENIVDRYPLATDDLEGYVEAAEEEEDD